MRTVNCSEIADQIRGVTYRKGDVEEEPFENSVPVLRAGNINDVSGNIIFDDLYYLEKDAINDSKIMKEGDILIAASSGSIDVVGKAALFKNNQESTFGAFCKTIRPHKERINSKYLFYFFRSKGYRRKIKELAQGANINNIKNEHLDDLEIPLPSLSKQKAIVAKLDRAQRLIDIDKEMFDKYDELIQSVFLEMFGDPVTNSKKWHRKPMEEIGEMKSGGTPSRKNKEYFVGDIDWYTTGELESMYLGEAEEKITETAIEESSAKLFEKGSLLIGMYDTSAFKLGILTGPGSSNQASANIKLDDEICNVEWLYYCLKIMRPSILHERRGIRQKNLTLGFLKKLEIIMPPLKKQLQFSKSQNKISDEKKSTELIAKKSKELFSSLVQGAFG